jgi:hypothetical protein
MVAFRAISARFQEGFLPGGGQADSYTGSLIIAVTPLPAGHAIPRQTLIYINTTGADIYRIGDRRLRQRIPLQHFEPGCIHEIRDKKDQDRGHDRTGL